MTSGPRVYPREFYMGRHGKTVHNESGMISSSDTPLVEEGRQGARGMSKVFSAIFSNPDNECHLITTEYPRAQETTRLMAPGREFAVEPKLNERGSGKLAGIISEAQFGAMMSSMKDRFETRVSRVTGVQSAGAHATQVVEGLNLQLEACPQGKTPVFVTHNLTMQSIARAMGMSSFKPKNSTLYHFVPNSQGSWNITEMSLDHGVLTEKPAIEPRGLLPSGKGGAAL